VHAIVAHFGLVHASRRRQAQWLGEFIEATVPAGAPVLVAGDFNDWAERLDPLMTTIGLKRALCEDAAPRRSMTFPSRVPVFALDRFYMRGFRCLNTMVPRGTAWARMSDHLPLIAELEPL